MIIGYYRPVFVLSGWKNSKYERISDQVVDVKVVYYVYIYSTLPTLEKSQLLKNCVGPCGTARIISKP